MIRLVRTLACIVLVAAGSGVGRASAAGLAGAPAPFDKGGIPVALVTLISDGDFFQAYQAGAQRQARALGIDLRVLQGRGDAAAERDAVQQAITLGVKGIIIDHGMPESLRDVAQAAVAAGIKVVSFDVDLANPRIPQIQHDDRALARAVLDQALRDAGDRFVAGYVYVAGFAPLDRRNAVWQEVKRAHPGIREAARWGTATSPVATAVADQSQAVFRAHPDITVVFAPWDEFARGVALAADEAGLDARIRIYSADISTADIQAMRAPNSPWVATAASDASVLGAVSVRADAMLLAGEDPGHDITVPPTLVTRGLLDRLSIDTVEQLEQRLPSFGHSDAARAPWMGTGE